LALTYFCLFFKYSKEKEIKNVNMSGWRIPIYDKGDWLLFYIMENAISNSLEVRNFIELQQLYFGYCVPE
jgi:hypothetical protein